MQVLLLAAQRMLLAAQRSGLAHHLAMQQACTDSPAACACIQVRTLPSSIATPSHTGAVLHQHWLIPQTFGLTARNHVLHWLKAPDQLASITLPAQAMFGNHPKERMRLNTRMHTR